MLRNWIEEFEAKFGGKSFLRNHVIDSYLSNYGFANKADKRISRPLRNFLRTTFLFDIFTTQGIKKYAYDELRNGGHRVLVILNPPYYETYTEGLLKGCMDIEPGKLYLGSKAIFSLDNEFFKLCES